MNKKTREYIISLLGEGIHTAFRKIPVHNAREIHSLIQKMPDEDWVAIIDFALDGIEDFIDSKKVKASIERDKKLVGY